MATRPAGNPRFSFGRSLSDTFSAFGGNFRLLVGLTVLLYGLPTILIGLFAVASMQEAISDPSMTAPFGPGYDGGWFVSAVCYVLAQLATTHLTLSARLGRSVSFGDALLVAIRRFLPALGIVGIYSIGLILIVATYGLGMAGLTGSIESMTGGFAVILLSFGLFLWALFYFAISFLVTVPAYLAEEETGVIGSFRRSWILTRGQKLKIFAILALLFVGMSMVVSAVMMAGAPAMMAGNPGDIGSFLWIFLILQAIAYTLLLAFFYPLVTMIYLNLREAKEGVLHERIAEIFE